MKTPSAAKLARSARAGVARVGVPPPPNEPARRFWQPWVERALARWQTPFYVFSPEPVAEQLGAFAALDLGVPVRHWLSCKTQPVRALLRWWRGQGRPVEVVSEFEYRAALAEGFGVDDILVNGPAKHRWITTCSRPGMRVHFDSVGEVAALAGLARAQGWRVGLRLLTDVEHDPEDPRWPTPFGLTPAEAVATYRRLRRIGVRVESVHFHLRSLVSDVGQYERALGQTAEVCREARWAPRYVDGGGGFPPETTCSRSGERYATAAYLSDAARVYRRVRSYFPGLEELWLENGRRWLAGSGVLVVKIADVKERRGVRQLLCDGGRTTHALVAAWEEHDLWSVPARGGRRVATAVQGATCMAFDYLTRRRLSAGLRVGDALVWMDAGAYHIPWETRFSHGIARVLWHEGKALRVVREPESFGQWWGQWSGLGGPDRE